MMGDGAALCGRLQVEERVDIAVWIEREDRIIVVIIAVLTPHSSFP
jgi:hypothetical protein